MSNSSPHSVEFTYVPFKSGWSMPTLMPTSLSNRDAIPTLAHLAKRPFHCSLTSCAFERPQLQVNIDCTIKTSQAAPQLVQQLYPQ